MSNLDKYSTVMASKNIFSELESENEVHNKLMVVFCCDYLGVESCKEKYEKFKLNSFLHLKNPAERSVSNCHDVWDMLERKGLLGLRNYVILKKLVNDIDDELIMLIEDAEDKISSIRGEEVKKRYRRPIIKDEDLSIRSFREKIYVVNYHETQRIQVSPLQKTSRMTMEEIFVPICIREDLEYRMKGRKIGMQEKCTLPVTCPNDMFYIDGNLARHVFLLGEAAIGKTVFCLRLVENWCKAQSPHSANVKSTVWVRAMNEFDFLFFVQLRHVDKSRTSVIDMISSDVFQNYPECRDSIRSIISDVKYQCLIVIDGLDEWKISDEAKLMLKVDGLPNIENMSCCTFIWSMRPWVMDKFSELIRGNDRVVEIQGLGPNGIDTLIEKILVNFYELNMRSLQYNVKVKDIKEKSQESKLTSIMQIPLMAIACIQIWFEEKDVGKSMTSLYVALLDLLVRRSNQKSTLSTNLKDILLQDSSKISHIPRVFAPFKSVKEIMSVIVKLGKLAYDDLFSNETHLVFRVEDLESYLENYELEFALKAGLLSKCEAPGSCNDENISVNFFHKSIQEYLAAVYIETNLEITKLYGHLFNSKVIMELSNVLIFLSGLNPQLGSAISQYVVDVVANDAEILGYRTLSDPAIYTQHKVEQLYKLQVSCYTEMIFSNTISDHKNLPYHVSDVYLHNESHIETIRATADILANNPADIESLWLYKVPNDGENGVPDSLLIQFLDRAKSLTSLLVDGVTTCRTLYSISDRFSSLTALLLYTVTLTPNAICALQTAFRSNTVIQTVGLVNIKCMTNKDQGREPALLSPLLTILPGLPRLATLHIAITNRFDKSVLLDVLRRLGHLRGIFYYSTHPDDNDFDYSVVQILSACSDLRWFSLFWIDCLGDVGLQLADHMDQLETVRLLKVDMKTSGWSKFLQSIIKIEHKFDVCLKAVHINEECLNMILSSTQINITYHKVDDIGNHDMIFARVGPPPNTTMPLS